MKDQDLEKALITLNSIVGCELAGVVKYTHFALMVTGPDRLVLDKFFKSQAIESLEHAQDAGELMTGLGGHPAQSIPEIKESNAHSIKDLLNESLTHEEQAIGLYKDLLACSENKSI